MYAFLPTYHCLIFVPFIERPTVKIKAIWKLIANKDFENNYAKPIEIRITEDKLPRLFTVEISEKNHSYNSCIFLNNHVTKN